MKKIRMTAAGLIVLAAVACGRSAGVPESQRMASLGSVELLGAPAGAPANIAAAKLREYCKACHAVGKLRFIWSESDEELWNYIFTQQAPSRKKLWAEAIAEVLSWPGEQPPPASPVMDPEAGRDWMPKGGKRATFAGDSVEGTPLRRYVLQALNDGLDDR